MKVKLVTLAPIFGLLCCLTNLSGEFLRFEFVDPGLDLGGISDPFGDDVDVVNGVVVMDTDSGAFSVSFTTNGLGFLNPTPFELHLINSSVNEGAGNMVSISGILPQEFSSGTVTIFSWEAGLAAEENFTTWNNGDYVSTSGYFNNTDYVSAVYSPGSEAVDYIYSSSSLSPNPEVLPVPGSGSGGDPNPDPEDEVDDDSDGIPDILDEWAYSDTNEFVYLLDVNTGIINQLTLDHESVPTGYTLADVIQLYELAAGEDYRNHGQYVQELVHNYKVLVKDGLITQKEYKILMQIIVKNRK